MLYTTYSNIGTIYNNLEGNEMPFQCSSAYKKYMYMNKLSLTTLCTIFQSVLEWWYINVTANY